MTPSRAVAWIGMVAFAVFATTCDCGPKPGTDDGGAAGEDAALGDDAGVGQDGGGGPPDGAFTDGGVCVLKPNGDACGGHGECCSNRCAIDPASDAGTGTCVAGGGTCFAIGGLCTSNIECCGGRTCAPDTTGQKRCIDESFCAAGGKPCTRASDCCSLSCGGCTAGDAGPTGCTCQTAGGLCSPQGTSCTSSTACCSNICATTCQPVAAGCGTLGERCTQNANCCSLYCVDMGAGGDAGSDLRCAASSSCRARGEICATNSNCCSTVCLNGQCPTQTMLGAQRFVGEPCLEDLDCASFACASTFQGGPKICQYLGGCRPAGEVCGQDFECCGYLELSQTRNQCRTAQPTPGACLILLTASDGGVLLRKCELQPTDKEAGEICYSSTGPVHNCCGGTAVCQPTVTGVSRCFGVGVVPDGGPDGGACLANGNLCSIADQCCTKVCAPGTTDAGTRLICSGCIADGAACTTNVDCCSQICAAGICGAAPDGGVICTPLGGACTADSPCCSTICSGSSCRTCRVLGDRCTSSINCCTGACVVGDGGTGTCEPIN